MLDIDEMSSKEIQSFLQQLGYGHLGFIHEFLLVLAAIVGLYLLCAETAKRVFYQHVQS